MRQAANLNGVQLPMLIPGITLNSDPTEFQLIKQAQMRRFNGERYVPFGPLRRDRLTRQAVATRSATADARPAPLNSGGPASEKITAFNPATLGYGRNPLPLSCGDQQTEQAVVVTQAGI
jgi:hypothetical protein